MGDQDAGEALGLQVCRGEVADWDCGGRRGQDSGQYHIAALGASLFIAKNAVCMFNTIFSIAKDTTSFNDKCWLDSIFISFRRIIRFPWDAYYFNEMFWFNSVLKGQ